MTSTSKALVLAPALLIALAACAPAKTREKSPTEKMQACQGLVDTMGFKETSAAKYIDGRDGVYKLTNLNVYQETKVGDSIAYFAGRSTLPIEADPLTPPASTPAPTPNPEIATNGEKPADPVKKPGFEQIVTKNEVVCFNMDAMAEGELNANVEAPLSISPKDGKVAKELPYKVVAQFKRLGEKATASEKSTAKSTTDVSSSELSPLEGCTLAGSNCTLFDTGKRSFAMRIEQTDATSKKILIAIYRLGALPKREEKKETPVEAPAQVPGAPTEAPAQPQN